MRKVNLLLSMLMAGVVLFLFSCQEQEDQFAPAPEVVEIGTSAELSRKTSSSANQSTTNSVTIEEEILALVNQHRATIGKAPLAMHQVIQSEAKKHSEFMAANSSLTHDGFADRATRIRTAIGGNGTAENVAYGYSTAQAVVNGWLNSAGHKKNIEGDYNLTGIGVAYNTSGVKYYTQIFHNAPNVSPDPEPEPDTNPTPDTDVSIAQIEQEVFTLINEHRQTKGLPALSNNTEIVKEARKHAENMANGVVPFGHTGFRDRAYALFAKLSGTRAAENVAYGQNVATTTIVNNWLNSSGHKANIEGAFNLTGVGVAKSADGKIYFTQIFIKN